MYFFEKSCGFSKKQGFMRILEVFFVLKMPFYLLQKN
jgi:hypothetical protein